MLAGEYCKEHDYSLTAIGPMRFRQNQERYIATRKLKDARNKHIDDHAPDSWSAMLIAGAELEGINNRHATERHMGPHTLADQKSYERLSRKLQQRKDLKAGLRENQRYMHMLQGDDRDEDFQVRIERQHYIRMLEIGEILTARDAFDAFTRHIQDIRAEERRRVAEEVWRDEQGEREYGRFGPAIPHAADGDNWLGQAHRERTLAEIANDRQSVHTSEVLKKFKEMVELIRKVEVPEEYCWNMSKVSKTMVEITAECELTPQAAWQFSSKYYSAETIYDMEEGIFGKLMDAVWQHVKASPESSELKKIVKEELEMNIGMCAQGNITRVANILVGILDGLAPEETSRLDKIVNAINALRPTLEGKTPVEIRLAAMKVLVQFRMTAEEMKPWVDAIVEAV